MKVPEVLLCWSSAVSSYSGHFWEWQYFGQLPFFVAYALKETCAVLLTIAPIVPRAPLEASDKGNVSFGNYDRTNFYGNITQFSQTVYLLKTFSRHVR